MLMIMEKMFIISTGINALDMSFFLLPTSIMLFVLTLRHITNTLFDNYTLMFRKLSVLIYNLHLLITFLINLIYSKLLHITIDNLIMFVICLSLTIMVSIFIINITNKKIQIFKSINIVNKFCFKKILWF